MEKGKSQEVGMTGLCQQCQAELPEGRKRFCSNECGVQFHNNQRKPSTEAKVEDVETREVDRVAQKLIVGGYLPEPFSIDPHDGRPVWDFAGIAALFNRKPDEVVKLLLANGPVHQHGQGIPSSWAMLQNMRL